MFFLKCLENEIKYNQIFNELRVYINGLDHPEKYNDVLEFLNILENSIKLKKIYTILLDKVQKYPKRMERSFTICFGFVVSLCMVMVIFIPFMVMPLFFLEMFILSGYLVFKEHKIKKYLSPKQESIKGIIELTV